MPTLLDVARLAGVGVMSVSRVVNGTRRVSPEVERKVRAALEKINYQPNEAARVLKGTRSSVLGLIVPDIAHPFFAACCSEIQQTAWENGYMTLIAASGHVEDRERHEVEMMLQRNISGLIVVPTGHQNEHFAAAVRQGVPIVSVDRPLDNVRSDCLIVNNLVASCEATKHLLQHGHERIICLADDERTHTKIERVNGYTLAMREANVAPRVCLIGPMTGSVADQLDLALAGPLRATAILATSDILGLAVLRYLQAHQLRMPTDAALISFDDFSGAALVTPPVTVVQQPVEELARRAATMLLSRVRDGDDSEVVRLELPTRLILRGSCGCKKSKR
jgi:LacI family transcriptional regulator